MSKYQAAIFAYAAAMIILGLIGYFVDSTHNLGSIIGGGAIGILEIFFGTLSTSKPRIGYIGAAVVALLTAGMFVPRSFQDPKWGFVTIAILSVLLVVILLGGHFLTKKVSKSN